MHSTFVVAATGKLPHASDRPRWSPGASFLIPVHPGWAFVYAIVRTGSFWRDVSGRPSLQSEVLEKRNQTHLSDIDCSPSAMEYATCLKGRNSW